MTGQNLQKTEFQKIEEDYENSVISLSLPVIAVLLLAYSDLPGSLHCKAVTLETNKFIIIIITIMMK